MLLCRNLQLRAISSSILIRSSPVVIPARYLRGKARDELSRPKNLVHTLNTIASGFRREKKREHSAKQIKRGNRQDREYAEEVEDREYEERGEDQSGGREYATGGNQKRKVHIRFNDQVVRFVVSKSTSLAQILKDAKLYFGVEDPNTELWDLSSDSTLTPSLHQSIFNLDANPDAYFFFQMLSEAPEPPLQQEPLEAQEEHQEVATESEQELSEEETVGGTEEWVSQKETNKMKQAKMEKLNKIQDDEYFRKTLFATNLTAAKKSENERPINPAFAHTNKMVEKLVTSVLASWQFKKFLENSRVPRLSETATAGFVASFLEDLEATQPKFCANLRIYAMSSQEDLEQDTHTLSGSKDETLRMLRKAIKQFAIRGAALHASMELEAKRQFTDLRSPWMWYKAARQMTRKIIIHTGPTNSGKTFHALERLAAAKSGMYCGPLRLLAHEVYEKLTAKGIECSLITGQQKIEPLFATHIACTVEMTDTDEPVEVAVVDEFQMLGDPERGWAWTRAILGCPAQEIHLCGDGSAVELIARVCTERLGDEVEIKRYERLSPLIAVKGGLHNGIQRGDAIVAFSRQKIHSFKQQIEKHTGFRCCVVYGSLPPEARSTQAALFNDPNSGYDVLVASDAIGMGLNLNIRRVVFSSLTKFDGVEERSLNVSEIKQIAGRAGRFGSIYPEGRVTCLNPRDSEKLVLSLQTPIPELQQMGLSPTYEQLEMFYMTDETKPPLSVLLDRFALYASIDNFFFLCDYTNIRELAVMLEPLKLDLKDLYTFCLSPADAKKPLVKHSLYQYASLYASDIRTVPLRIEPGADGPIYHGMPHLLDTFDEREKLKRLEELYLVADMYAWLSFRLSKFDEREKSLVVKTQVHAQISALLDSMSEAQGEATWSRIDRMRKEAQLQRDAQAMRMLDKDARRDRKIKWDEDTVVVNPARAQETQAPTQLQMDLARGQVHAEALAMPQVQPHALPQPLSHEAVERQQVRASIQGKPSHAYAQARVHRPTRTKEAFEKQFFQGTAQHPRGPHATQNSAHSPVWPSWEASRQKLRNYPNARASAGANAGNFPTAHQQAQQRPHQQPQQQHPQKQNQQQQYQQRYQQPQQQPQQYQQPPQLPQPLQHQQPQQQQQQQQQQPPPPPPPPPPPQQQHQYQHIHQQHEQKNTPQQMPNAPNFFINKFKDHADRGRHNNNQQSDKSSSGIRSKSFVKKYGSMALKSSRKGTFFGLALKKANNNTEQTNDNQTTSNTENTNNNNNNDEKIKENNNNNNNNNNNSSSNNNNNSNNNNSSSKNNNNNKSSNNNARKVVQQVKRMLENS